MHVHISALSFIITSAYIIIFAFLWRSAAAKLSETDIGKAMSYIF